MATSKKQSTFSHSRLCELAVTWLKRPHGRGGHGCHVALSEVRSGFNGEIPDAIGFRSTGFQDGSVVVEVKVSRQDFLSDKNKPHRSGAAVGLGNWRYYLCPEGLIRPDELPDKWGLIYASGHRTLKVIVGPYTVQNIHEQRKILADMKFDKDSEREQFLLVKTLARIEDPDKVLKSIREAEGEASRLRAYNEQLQEKLKTQRRGSVLSRKL